MNSKIDHLIRRCAAWVGGRFRRDARPPALPALLVPYPVRRALYVVPRGARLPQIFDGDATPLVRPYLIAHEERERRIAMAPGVGVGPWFIPDMSVVEAW
ncbi:hypothetical protein [Streptomyces gobiensis]|uniref:hypothetical protein n=1 Tax=Streptomyces gobiensis TaxID=2875706 RepID=UPI001E34594B|nr:hypothetical protein [Streptomyces gobiensis]UGY93580.1 hypothetical protein test1122_18890 [Streptomyces gobiensis]